MRTLILNGSPRKEGNTSALVDKIVEKLRAGGIEPTVVSLYDKDIKGCCNCGACQKAVLKDHCTMKDDMARVYEEFLYAETVILVSPIYMWQMTPCALAVLNRLHALCQAGDFSYNAMKGKRMAFVSTMGDGVECADSAVTGVMDMCDYFKMDYRGTVRIPCAKRDDILSGKYDETIDSFVSKL